MGTEQVVAAAALVVSAAAVAVVALLTWLAVEVRRVGRSVTVLPSTLTSWWPSEEESAASAEGDVLDELDAAHAREEAYLVDLEERRREAEASRVSMVTATPEAAVSDAPEASDALPCGGTHKHHSWDAGTCRRCGVSQAKRPAARPASPSAPTARETREPAEPVCSGVHDRHTYDGVKGDPNRRCSRCGARAPKYSSARAEVTTAEQASAWQAGRVPATSAGPEAREGVRREDGRLNRAALRGGAPVDLTVMGEVADPAPVQSVALGLTSVTPSTDAACPKCAGRLVQEMDVYGDTDIHCLACGYRPVRTVAPDEDPSAVPAGRQRASRGASHGGMCI